MNEEPKTKVCTGCHKRKPLASFYKKKGGKYGVAGECKVCHKIRQEEWKDANKEKVLAYAIANREKHREAINQRANARFAALPERKKNKKRAYSRWYYWNVTRPAKEKR